MVRHSLITLAVTCFLLLSGELTAREFLPPGHRPRAPGLHALVDARIVVAPGEVIEQGIVILRDGFIEDVGASVAVPAEARVWDLSGHTIYAGFIDASLDLVADKGDSSAPDETDGSGSAADTLDGLRAGFLGVPGDEVDPGGSGPGASIAKVSPQEMVANGFSPKAKAIASLHELGFTAGNVVPKRGIFRGTSAFVLLAPDNPNQSILSERVFQHVAFERGSWGDRTYPASLMGSIAVVRQTLFDAADHVRRLAEYGRSPQGKLRPGFNPALDALAPALNGELAVAFHTEGILQSQGVRRVAEEHGLSFVLYGDGEEWRRPGLVVTPGTLIVLPIDFPELPKLPEPELWEQVSLDSLRRWDLAPENPALLRELGAEVAITSRGHKSLSAFKKHLRLAIARGLAEDDALAALTTIPAKLCGVTDRLGTIAPGLMANLTVVTGDSFFEEESELLEVWVDGRRIPSAKREAEGEAEDEEKQDEEKQGEGKESEEEGGKDSAEEPAADSRATRTARDPQAGRGPIVAPPAILVRNATVWTCAEDGVLEQSDLLIVGAKIHSIGQGLEVPEELAGNAEVIDGTGLHLTPGLIDCHNHSMIVGGVNEGTLPSSAMVRIADVVNSETENIYRQLAGGLTVANLLHGSANPIGGQNAVVKLRDGADPEQLLFEGAPAGIKFALGENVKQSNWGDENVTRFPQTRMGVKTFFNNRFHAARQYIEAWERHSLEGGVPPRRDLELDALGEILRGERLIHCHSYRQDEILMLIRLMDSFGVRVGTFQHVLEGYKVADEIAAHGAGGSCFSDWWAYKFEVYDAIPYAGAIMHERGVLTSFNSDSSDVARRMNLEAAKAVKYGGLPEEEALCFVTLYPAQQLGIDSRVGSLEPGKDADFALWSGHPLSTASKCQSTWIEGKKYFDIELDRERTTTRASERASLLVLAKKKKAGKDKDTDGDSDEEERRFRRFFARSLEHEHDLGDDVHCLGVSGCGAHGHEGRELR